MQQLAHAETSYSALLHGPDTPPFNSGPAWITSTEGKHHSAAESSSRPSQSATVKNQASLNNYEGSPAAFVTQNFWHQQLKFEQRLPTKDTSNLGSADAMEQAPFHSNVGRQIRHTVRYAAEKDCSPHQVDSRQGFHGSSMSQRHLYDQNLVGENEKSVRPCVREDVSLPNDGPSLTQSQQCAMSFNSEANDANYTHAHRQQNIAENSFCKQQEGMAPRSRALPPGHMPNGFDPQQYSAWNVVHKQSMGGASGSHMQHPSHTGYNRWATSAWVEGHPPMQHTPYLPYSSGHMQLGANHHAAYNWETQSTGTMAAAYAHYYPEGYYSCGNFNSVGETNHAAPPAFVNYNHHCQEPGAYLPTADHYSTRFRTFHERQEMEGRQVRHLQSTCEDPIQCAHISKKCREEEEVKNGNAIDRETAYHQEEAELEGPQAKKLREFSQVDAYQPKSCQVSEKFSPQTGASSSVNVADLSGVDGTPSSSRNSSDVQGSTLKDRRSQVVSQGCEFENGLEQQGRSSDLAARTFQRAGMPSHLQTKDATQAETSLKKISGQSFHRDHTRPTSVVFSSENGSGLSQNDSIPGVRFLPGAQQMQKHEYNNAFFPGGSQDVYKEDFSSTRPNTSVSGAQDQFSSDPFMRQLGGRAQAVSPPGAPSFFHTTNLQQRSMPAVAPKTAFSGFKVSSGVAIQELPESQSTMFPPSNIGESPGIMYTHNVSYGDTHANQYAYSTSGYDNSSMVDKDEYLTSNVHAEAEQQRTLYSMTSAYASHLRPAGQTQEVRSFDHPTAGSLETGAQLRVLSRPALEKVYPPPPFPNHPLQFQRERGSVANTPIEGDILPQSQALVNSEAALPTNEMKERAPNLVKYQASAGYMVKGGFLYPAAGESEVMRKGSVLSELGQVHQLSVSSGIVSKQQPCNTEFHAHASHTFPSNTIHSHALPSSITAGPQGSAGPTQITWDSETSKSSQPSGYPVPVATGRSFRQADENQHRPPVHFDDIHMVGREYATTVDGEVSASGQTLIERIPQQAFKASIRAVRAPLTTQPKKRKKSGPCFIPWHIVTTQPRGQLPSLSKAELMWATATNRLLDKDGGEVLNLGLFRAESRLRLTTQLMQQIFSPLPSALMHGNKSFNLESGVYAISKSALGEACRLMAGTERENESAQKVRDIKIIPSDGRTRTWNMAKEVAMIRLVERFMERVKRLDFELASRLEDGV
ncbi:hypothetical protein L7F22_034660 [Adiantum nelumboides]|nr:hypothetical protein [Adiantum nelumboides]